MPLHYQIQIEKLEKLEQLEQLEQLEKLAPVQQTTALYLLHRTTYRAPVPVRTTYRCVVLLCARHLAPARCNTLPLVRPGGNCTAHVNPPWLGFPPSCLDIVDEMPHGTPAPLVPFPLHQVVNGLGDALRMLRTNLLSACIFQQIQCADGWKCPGHCDSQTTHFQHSTEPNSCILHRNTIWSKIYIRTTSFKIF